MGSERSLLLSRIPLGEIPAERPSELAPRTLRLYWLGQAGFLIDAAPEHAPRPLRLLIDPYLSDSLAEKYRGKEFPHIRMMPVPVEPQRLSGVDAVFCSHGHSDHLDPGTLPILAENNPSCRFVIPEAVRETALARGVPERRIIALDSGDGFEGEGGLKITALASAHEELSLSERGEQLYLGYGIDFGGFSLYHSGDCVPYEGLAETLGQLSPDLFLLPVNGRDRTRTEKGILGNFTLEEALDLAEKAGAESFIGHHFGMFEFNTIDPAHASRILAARAGLRPFPCGSFLAEMNLCYEFTWSGL